MVAQSPSPYSSNIKETSYSPDDSHIGADLDVRALSPSAPMLRVLAILGGDGGRIVGVGAQAQPLGPRLRNDQRDRASIRRADAVALTAPTAAAQKGQSEGVDWHLRFSEMHFLWFYSVEFIFYILENKRYTIVNGLIKLGDFLMIFFKFN